MKRHLVATLCLLTWFASPAAAQVSMPVRVRTPESTMQALIIKKVAPPTLHWRVKPKSKAWSS